MGSRCDRARNHAADGEWITQGGSLVRARSDVNARLVQRASRGRALCSVAIILQSEICNLKCHNQDVNRLSSERSPYLLQHQNNPVQWYPWGPEALGRAKQEDKPIFLSIGYSACHWCHVMEHESFEDERIAALMNEHVINIIIEDFVAACDPISVDIEGDFHVRGNIKTVVKASYQR